MIFGTDSNGGLSTKLSIRDLLPPTLQPHHKKTKTKNSME